MAKRKKTKQEKIISHLRRQVAISLPLPLATSSSSPVEKKTIATPVSLGSNFVKKDLSKTLFLSLVIIVLEIVLYSRLN